MVESLAGREFQKRVDIPTTDELLSDNQSQKAEENRALYRESKLAGKVYIVRTCSDSRAANGLPLHRVTHVPSIASSGELVPYGEMVKNQAIQGIATVIHFDGVSYKLGHKPDKCGGFDAKAASKQNSERKGTSIERYIDRIPSDDPVVSNFFQAELLANVSNKPVLAAIQDHRTAVYYPMALFLDGGRTIRTSMPVRHLLQDLYDEKTIYEKGVPCLSEDQLIPDFQEFLELNKIESARIQREYNSFTEDTATQNPEFLVFTTEKTTARERYPETLRRPSSYFSIHIARENTNGNLAVVPRNAIEEAINQAEYPISHFSNIHTILIETPDIIQSRAFAKELLKTMKSEEWKVAGSFQTIAASSISGRTTQMEVVK